MRQNSSKYIIAFTNCEMAPAPFNIAQEKIKSLVVDVNLLAKYI